MTETQVKSEIADLMKAMRDFKLSAEYAVGQARMRGRGRRKIVSWEGFLHLFFNRDMPIHFGVCRYNRRVTGVSYEICLFWLVLIIVPSGFWNNFYRRGGRRFLRLYPAAETGRWQSKVPNVSSPNLSKKTGLPSDGYLTRNGSN